MIALLTLAMVATSCTVKETSAPAVSGPSELALSLTVQAAPDLVYQDGISQSAVTVEARGPNSQPARGIAMRVDMVVDGVQADFGTVSTRTLVTGDDGRARLTYTAPPRPAQPGGAGSIVTLTVTPLSGDARGDVGRQVDIRVVPVGVILPPNGAPVPDFSFSPTAPVAFQGVGFDASITQDEGVLCGANCSYSWTFGDGGSGSGQVTQHEYRAAGSYVVTLRVTDIRGQTAQVSKTLTVAAGTPPTAAFTFSPTTPRTSQDIFFTAEASRATNGRRLVAYDWNFGSGRTGTGVTIAKRYDTPGTYVVTLTVTDDAFQQTTVSQTITVTP
jgi:PKD repeat protein